MLYNFSHCIIHPSSRSRTPVLAISWSCGVPDVLDELGVREVALPREKPEVARVGETLHELELGCEPVHGAAATAALKGSIARVLAQE